MSETLTTPPATIACPALLVAAPASGQGKTTLTAALARLHRRLGRRVTVFKCGPDFLDPQIHAMASGRPCHTLDFGMAGEDDARWRLAKAAAESDLILVEGVMGLHDGEPSAAELARRLGLPVLLVLDAAAMAGSFGAVAWGLKHYRKGAPISAVLANRVGSDYHAQLCRDTLPEDIAWYGHLPRRDDMAMPERHLGLLPAAEVADLEARLDAMADALTTTPAAALPPEVHFPLQAEPRWPPLLAGRRIAVASDSAFCFAYPANLELLRQLGAELLPFSPVQDQALPECDALWLPGGYPELHAARLAANTPMLAALRAHVAAGKPALAECGGMMLLFDTLVDLHGASNKIAGILPGRVVMQKRLAGLGFQQADLGQGWLKGHTFHFSRAESPMAASLQAEGRQGRPGEAIWRLQKLTASYCHFYFPSNPAASAALFL